MKAGIFSGGGAFGAFTVGVLNRYRPDYNITYGTSTGALIAPFAALGDYQRLKELYTNTTSKDIFTYNPFDKNGHLSWIKVLWRLIRFKKTIGDTTNLYKSIKKNFTKEDYEKIKSMGKDVCITVCSLSDRVQRTNYVYLSRTSYENFCFYMWASTCVPVVCSVAKKGEFEYVDGGVTESTPIIRAIEDGCKDLDVYLHDAPEKNGIQKPTANIFNLAARVFRIMRQEIKSDDMLMANVYNRYADSDSKVNIKYYQPKNQLGDNALLFDKDKMLEWYSYGYNT